jgi:hypothetical protein
MTQRARVRSRLVGSILLLATFAATSSAPEAGSPQGPPTVAVQPVTGVTVGAGRKLWVFVHPVPGRGKPQATTTCTADGDSQTAETAPEFLGFVLPGPISFKINAASIPIDKGTATGAITNSFMNWQAQTGKAFFDTISDHGGASGPAADGNNTVGWARLVPRNTLAATWVWTETINGVDYVTDADIFYNSFHDWGVFGTCTPTETRFEVENVGTHEVGHVIGLAHVKDAEAMATMYPTAAPGETKKKTLTATDIAGATDLAP